MKRLILTAILVVSLFFLTLNHAHSEPLAGVTGSGSGPAWSAGWIDLSTMTDFKRGDRLRLSVGGTAENILVRLLPAGADANSPVGIDGDVVRVPRNRVVEVILRQDHLKVVQISVHGKQMAFQYNLGGGNGPVTLKSVERVSP